MIKISGTINSEGLEGRIENIASSIKRVLQQCIVDEESSDGEIKITVSMNREDGTFNVIAS